MRNRRTIALINRVYNKNRIYSDVEVPINEAKLGKSSPIHIDAAITKAGLQIKKGNFHYLKDGLVMTKDPNQTYKSIKIPRRKGFKLKRAVGDGLT